MLDVEDIDSSIVHSIPSELDAIRDLLADYVVKVNEFLYDFKDELESPVVAYWRKDEES